MVGAFLVRKPLQFWELKGILTNLVEHDLFKIRISKDFLTNKAPADIDTGWYTSSRHHKKPLGSF